jgi:hypothetical protein
VALAAGALLSWTMLGLLVDPIGDVAVVPKLLHYVVMTVGVAVLIAVAVRRAMAPDRELVTM